MKQRALQRQRFKKGDLVKGVGFKASLNRGVSGGDLQGAKCRTYICENTTWLTEAVRTR